MQYDFLNFDLNDQILFLEFSAPIIAFTHFLFCKFEKLTLAAGYGLTNSGEKENWIVVDEEQVELALDALVQGSANTFGCDPKSICPYLRDPKIW